MGAGNRLRLSPAPRRGDFPILDDTLPHQIRILVHRDQKLMVSCTCQATGPKGGLKPLAIRECFSAGEAVALWRAHLPKETITDG